MEAADAPSADSKEVAQTYTVAGWTLVSRVTGLLRVIVAGATLGPTFFANIFQATNSVPNITYNLMAGSLLTSLMVPVIVRAIDHEGLERGRDIARKLTGTVLVGFSAVGLLVVAAGPIIVRLLTLAINDPVEQASAQRQCWALLLLVVPQIVLYGVITVGIAAQNARRHYALAAAAPAVENVGLILTLVLAARIFGAPHGIAEVSSGYLIFLGAGATLAVAAHAGLQVFGAARVGLPLRPAWGWNDPVIRGVIKRAIPAAGTAVLDAGWTFALIVAAGSVPGGVIALQVGLNFYNLPVALSAKAAGTVMLPQMAQDAARKNWGRFRQTFDRGVSWSWFVAAPAGVALFMLARPIADALAFGEMRRGNGIELLTASLRFFAFALLAAATVEFVRQACYSRHNVGSPFFGALGMIIVTLLGIPIAIEGFSGAGTLGALGAVAAVSMLVQAAIVVRAVNRGIPRTFPFLLRRLTAHLGVALVTIAPAALLGNLVATAVPTHAGAILGVGVGAGIGIAAYLAVQGMLRAPELPIAFHHAPRLERDTAAA